jgi:hypothetical protein
MNTQKYTQSASLTHWPALTRSSFAFAKAPKIHSVALDGAPTMMALKSIVATPPQANFAQNFFGDLLTRASQITAPAISPQMQSLATRALVVGGGLLLPALAQAGSQEDVLVLSLIGGMTLGTLAATAALGVLSYYSIRHINADHKEKLAQIRKDGSISSAKMRANPLKEKALLYQSRLAEKGKHLTSFSSKQEIQKLIALSKAQIDELDQCLENIKSSTPEDLEKYNDAFEDIQRQVYVTNDTLYRTDLDLI